MKSSLATLLLALAIVSPSLAADLKGDLLAMEKSIWKAWSSHDVNAYADHMTADAVLMAAGGSVSTDREKMIEDVGSHPCTLKAIDFTDTNVRQPTPRPCDSHVHGDTGHYM